MHTYRGLKCKYRAHWVRTRGQDGKIYSADHFRVFVHGPDGPDGFPACKEHTSICPIVPALFGRE